MRHDPASAAVVVMLRSLKMYGMAQAVGDLIEQGAPAFDAVVPILSQLLKAEVAEREVRSIAYQIKAAKFPAYKDLAGFDFASSEVNEAMVRQLHRGEFIDGAHNVVLIGGPGTGKTHIATALGVQAVEHHRKKARFFATVDLVNALEQEKAMNKAGQLADRLLRLKALDFFAWAEDVLSKASARSPLAEALRYAVKLKPALLAYTDDGKLEIDNNPAENALRGIAVGRKNWLFAGADCGGERAAAMYSLLETAKLNGVNPQEWLADVLDRIGKGHPINRIDELLPWKWSIHAE